MLQQFDGRKLRVTTEDGSVFTGRAEALPRGWGLCEFNRAEESLRIGSVTLFQSDIRSVELLPGGGTIEPRQFDALLGELLEGPYWIADILPAQVPENAGGQYFAVEHYFLQTERRRALYRRFAEILLRLNCYYDMAVSFDSCSSWEQDPEPEAFAARLADLGGNAWMRAVFAPQRAMIDLEPGDLYMTVYDPGGGILERLRQLAQAVGLFVWQPRQNG